MPEPAQIARDRSLKKTNSKYKTRGGGASDVKNVMVQPPSAASERVFSILSASFDDQITYKKV